MTGEGTGQKRKALASFIQDAIDKGATTVGTLASDLLHDAAKRKGARAGASARHHTGTR